MKTLLKNKNLTHIYKEFIKDNIKIDAIGISAQNKTLLFNTTINSIFQSTKLEQFITEAFKNDDKITIFCFINQQKTILLNQITITNETELNDILCFCCYMSLLI